MIDPVTAIGIATAAYEIADTIGSLASSAFGSSAMTVEIFNLTEDVTLSLEYQSTRTDEGVEGKFSGDLSGKGPPPDKIPPAKKDEKAKAGVFQSVNRDNDPRGNRNFVIYKAQKPGFHPIYLRIAWSIPGEGPLTFYFVRWQREWNMEEHRDNVVPMNGHFLKNGKWEKIVGTFINDWLMQTATDFVAAEDAKNNSIRGVQRDTQRLISITAAGASGPALQVTGTFGFAPLKIFVQDAWVKSGERDYTDKDLPLSHWKNGPPQ